MNEEIKSKHEENICMINMTIEEQVAQLKGQITIQELHNELDKVKHQGSADAKKAEAETRSIVAEYEAEICKIISDSEKHIEQNKADVKERGNNVVHKAIMNTLEEKAKMKELGLSEDDFLNIHDKTRKNDTGK